MAQIIDNRSPGSGEIYNFAISWVSILIFMNLRIQTISNNPSVVKVVEAWNESLISMHIMKTHGKYTGALSPLSLQ